MSRAVVIVGAALAFSAFPQVKGSGTLVWKDATGAIVTDVDGRTLDVGGALNLRDSNGYFWKIYPSNLRVTVEQQNPALGSWQAFTSTDCTGIAYFIGSSPPNFPPPRVTFTALDDPTIRVRPDDLAEEVITRCSAMTDSGCRRVDPCDGPYAAIRAADTVPPKPLTPPTLSYVAPLHPELP